MEVRRSTCLCSGRLPSMQRPAQLPRLPISLLGRNLPLELLGRLRAIVPWLSEALLPTHAAAYTSVYIRAYTFSELSPEQRVEFAFSFFKFAVELMRQVVNEAELGVADSQAAADTAALEPDHDEQVADHSAGDHNEQAELEQDHTTVDHDEQGFMHTAIDRKFSL